MIEATETAADLRTIAQSTDTELAQLDDDAATAQHLMGSAVDAMHRALGSTRTGTYNSRSWSWNRTTAEIVELARNADPDRLTAWDRRQVQRSLELFTRSEEKLAEIEDRVDALNEVFYSHGGWSRFFIVAGGHIHSTTRCHTCNRGKNPTRFGWLPDLSALTEADAVAAHGALLCTACYPSAPTEWTDFYEKKERAAAAARCPGSGTLDYPAVDRRRYVTCNVCGSTVSRTSTGKMRSHKPAPK